MNRWRSSRLTDARMTHSIGVEIRIVSILPPVSGHGRYHWSDIVVFDR